MAYYHSQGAAKALREKLDKETLLKNLQVRMRYADDSERRELEDRIQELRSELNKL